MQFHVWIELGCVRSLSRILIGYPSQVDQPSNTSLNEELQLLCPNEHACIIMMKVIIKMLYGKDCCFPMQLF